MGIGEIFTILFTNPITNLLILFYKVLLMVNIPYPLAFSIILLTAVIKLILYPLGTSQIKSAQKMQKINPHMATIREKHKNDKKRQQEEMMKLYKEHGVNPAAGCLPTLIQFPVIISLYNVLTNVVGANTAALLKINTILYSPFLTIDPRAWNPSFLGASLADSPSALFSKVPFIILVPVVTGIIQFILSKMMIPESSLIPLKKGEKKSDDFATTFQTQSLFIFPVMIGFFSYTLPIGLSLYWNTFSLFGILQQYLLVGPGALKPWLEKIKPSR